MWYDGEQLSYEEPKILEAPNPWEQNGRPVVWRKNIDIRLAGNKRVKGFVAIREKSKIAEAGLALFRRNRLILGSADEGYRPTFIFGQSNSYRYGRVFGELHLDGFGVSHTKDAFQWEDLEEEFLNELKKQMDSDPLPILRMAEEYRALTKTTNVSRVALSAATSTAQALSTAKAVIDAQRHERPVTSTLPQQLPAPTDTAASKEFQLSFQDQDWIVTIDLVNDVGIEDWLEDLQKPRNERQRQLGIRVNLAHPFMQRFGGASGEETRTSTQGWCRTCHRRNCCKG